ncbi:MAG: glmS 1 [Candidatus Berkelbacteria bacterium]|nr:glmS 1 [Candidatus Berkelbacteria bacterium]
MCGITGYIGSKKTYEVLLDGLRRLEYRGYDSSGIAVQVGNSIKFLKRKGKIIELEKSPEIKNMVGTMGISHTRWATHGIPNEINAHPHLDCKKEIALVHNGIIENYHQLKEKLVREGHKFISATDTEVVAHLIEKYYKKNNFESAVVRAIEDIHGSFALAIIHKDSEKLIAARRGSPLIIGVGRNENFIGSDVPAILKFTKKVIYLNDDEIAILSPNNIIVKNLQGKIIRPKVNEIKWSLDQIEKGGFKHFMLKEIFEQPQAISNALSARIINNKIKLDLKINPKNLQRIFLVACGTAWHAGLVGKYIIEKLTRKSVEVDIASEFRYRNPIIGKGDLLIAVSQSGETADTLESIKLAKHQGAKTLGIVNAVGSSIAREVDEVIYLQAGPEIGVASTKAFTCQVICLLLFALYMGEKGGNKIEKIVIKDLQALPKLIKKILSKSKDIQKIAKKYVNAQSSLYLGRGINFPIALEGALKLKEISYIHAEGYPAGEMKHGPIALVDEKLPVIFIANDDHTLEKIISNMEEIKARQGKIITVTNVAAEKIKKVSDDIIGVPKTSEIISALINVVPLQILAYYVADLRGIDMDKPRNLAKSVTVE